VSSQVEPGAKTQQKSSLARYLLIIRSIGNHFLYFPENQLTKFIAVSTYAYIVWRIKGPGPSVFPLVYATLPRHANFQRIPKFAPC